MAHATQLALAKTLFRWSLTSPRYWYVFHCRGNSDHFPWELCLANLQQLLHTCTTASAYTLVSYQVFTGPSCSATTRKSFGDFRPGASSSLNAIVTVAAGAAAAAVAAAVTTATVAATGGCCGFVTVIIAITVKRSCWAMYVMAPGGAVIHCCTACLVSVVEQITALLALLRLIPNVVALLSV